MMVVIPVQHGKAILVILHQRDSRVVPMGRAAQLAEGPALQSTQHHPQRRPMAEYRHGFAVVFQGDLRQRRDKPIQHLLSRLAAGHLPAVQMAVKVHNALLVLHAQLLPGVAFPHAHIHLPQVRVGVQGQALGQIYGPGRGAGAEQVAAVYGVDMYVLKPLLQGCHLLIPPGGNESVIMAVGNAVEIPLCLGVSD